MVSDFVRNDAEVKDWGTVSKRDKSEDTLEEACSSSALYTKNPRY
jgi:hypothetical protein